MTIKGVIRTTYQRYLNKPKKPRLHPIAQYLGQEEKHAAEKKVPINWDNVSAADVERSCLQLRVDYPDWHPDLSTLDLSAYLDEIPPKKFWWRTQHPAVQVGDDGMCYPTPQSSG